MRPPGRPAAAQLDEDGLPPALYDDRLTRCAKTTGGGSPMCCRVSPPATFELSGSGKADDGSTGAIHQSAAAVGAEAGLDGAVAGACELPSVVARSACWGPRQPAGGWRWSGCRTTLATGSAAGAGCNSPWLPPPRPPPCRPRRSSTPAQSSSSGGSSAAPAQDCL